MNDQYRRIKNFVFQAIQFRDTLSPEKLPSKYWTDFAQNFRYVYELSHNELLRIRYHTYHLTSDSYLTYYFANSDFRQLLENGWRYFTEGWQLAPIDETNHGIGMDTEYGRISHDLLRYIGVVCDLKDANIFDHDRSKTIMEIGGGYGGLARTHIIQNSRLHYIICDLEETIFFSAVYLSILLGCDKIHLVNSKLQQSDLKFGHIYIVPQSRMEFIKDIQVDYAISQQSLQEMTFFQVEFYTQWLSDHADYLFSCNLNDHGRIADKKDLITDLHSFLDDKFGAPSWVGNIPKNELRFGDNQLLRAVYQCGKK